MCTSAGRIRVSGGMDSFPRFVKHARAPVIMLRHMTLGRVAALTGLALGVMAANVAISILYMVLYSYVIDPGHEKAYYEAHVQVAAPYCSIVAGIPLMFLVGWWVGVRPGIVVWLVYAIIDLAVVAASGVTLRMGALVAISLLTKLVSAYLGAVANPRP